jgi:signal transduction histidine kinase/ActR/RegA family two-component response regulator
MPGSVSRRFLFGLCLTSLAFTVLTALAAFVVFEQELESRQVHFLSQYVQERSDNVGRRFSNLITLHRSAVEALNARLATLTPHEADRLLDLHTTLLPDGTRRSRPESFDGYVDRDGGRTYGVGAFIGQAGSMTPDEKRTMAAAFPIVARFGQAAHGDYDNLYFFAPKTRLVMFGPDRPDKLMFYRHDAPASLDVSHQEMSLMAAPAANPTGATRCTSLQRLVQDAKSAHRLATACVTPAYVQGRYVGAFGSSIRLDGFLSRVVGGGLAGAQTLIMRADGVLVASPHDGGRNECGVASYEHALQLPALAKRMAKAGDRFGVISSADGKDIVAYGKLQGPDWYLLVSYPKAAIMRSAAGSAWWILLIGLIGAGLQTLLLVRLARKVIVNPLQSLARSCQSEGQEDVSELVGRDDEIGVLARSLVAERARGDDMLATLEQRVRERTAELEHANAEKSRFLANMSHELRTPLNGVIAISDTLAREQTTPRNVELAELIASSGRLLERVLTDILDFSKIEAGDMRLDHRPFDLQTIVSHVAELHRASAEAKGVAFHLEMSPQAAGGYVGDPVRLTQVLSNLLSNAVKFTDHGSVSLNIEHVGDQTRFAVSDTGIGFDEDVRARLFQRFEQADLSIRKRYGGTGLGLVICRSLVGSMGGVIDVRSAPAEGSCFTLTLPLGRTSLSDQDETADQDDDDVSLAGVRILLAEDHPTNQKVIELIIGMVEADLTIVENGRLALEALEAEAFDIVLMDMQMPELDGLSATALIREREARLGLARLPVIMLTANALDEHVRASLEAGADRHIAKPVRAEELLNAIADFLEPEDSQLGNAEAA